MDTMADSTVELTSFPSARNGDTYLNSLQSRADQAQEESAEHNTQSLPPVHVGWQAWTFLAACFALEAIVWGL